MEACKPDRKKLERFLRDLDTDQQVEIFKLLANPIRLKIALLLSQDGELCTCDLEAILGCEQTLISHHMRAFKELEVVTERREGKWKHYSLRDDRLKRILEEIKSS